MKPDAQRDRCDVVDSEMAVEMCRLCLSHPAIEESHVLPRFLFRSIKSDSPTGFFRNPNDPNRRFQDGDKFPLLCAGCEQRFGDAESKFARHVFSAFHSSDQDHFRYGPWLHYFMTSLAWRTLILNLPGLESDSANPRSAVALLKATAEEMRKYLLGANNLAGRLRNHAIVWTQGQCGSAELAAAGPNVKIRRSVFGYTIIDRANGYSGILHNLAGFMCFLIVKGNPRDTWDGTKVDPSGGEISQPQRADSWLIAEFLSCIVEFAQGLTAMSPAQKQRVNEAVRKNPAARGLRFSELDRRFVVSK